MTCTDCPALKRITCIVACDEMNEKFNRMEEREGAMHSIHFMAWLTIVIIIGAVAACCSVISVPDSVNVQDLRGAAKYQAMQEVAR